jgi:rare lipoprotein A (peptidoglycan hydrolase)
MRPFIFLFAALASIGVARAETGLASWYGSREEGRPMANGKPFHADGINAAVAAQPTPLSA